MATYAISIHTGHIGPAGDHEGSGGEAAPEVHVTLFGSKASSPEISLGGPDGSAPDAPTTRRVALGDLGDIQRVRVRHDDPGIGPGCYLDRVVVQLGGSLQEWTFLCQRWLGRHADDGTEQTLDGGAGAT